MFFAGRTGNCFQMRPFRFRRFAALFGLIFGILAATAFHSAYAESATGEIRAFDASFEVLISGLAPIATPTISLMMPSKAGLSGELAGARHPFARAQVNEKSGAFARAFQDYSNALWMGKPVSQPNAKRRRMARRASPPRWASVRRDAAKAAAATPASTDGSSGGFLSGLFGSSSSSAERRLRPRRSRSQLGPACGKTADSFRRACVFG